MIPIPLHAEYYDPAVIQQLHHLIASGSLNSDNYFSEQAEQWFNSFFNCPQSLLTSSCTDALEMIGLILNLEEGDEVIVPAYTYVSTANAFRLRTSQLRFADCLPHRPVVDLSTIKGLVTIKTKAIVVMHYGGIAVDMPPLIDFCRRQQIALIEDAAHAFGASYLNQPLGSFGDFATFSFHYTKPISCGEGGCLLVNDSRWMDKANCIFEKGTNRRAYKEQHLSKYEWVDLGSSFGMSASQACILASQLPVCGELISKRIAVWDSYLNLLGSIRQKESFLLPDVPEFNKVNGSYFYITLKEPSKRNDLIRFLKNSGIESSFHYLSLHKSPFYANQRNQYLVNSDAFESGLVRLPIYPMLRTDQVEYIADRIEAFFCGSI